MTVGILALQGDFAEHCDVLASLGVDYKEVRTVEDLQSVDRLIFPGGESTTISKLLKTSGLFSAIQERYKTGTLACFGTCAGAILLAKKVSGTIVPDSLGLMDIHIERNAYGRQIQSFQTELPIQELGTTLSVSFIRAPKISDTANSVSVLSTHEGHPVLVRQGRCLASTFHPEVRLCSDIHEFFCSDSFS